MSGHNPADNQDQRELPGGDPPIVEPPWVLVVRYALSTLTIIAWIVMLFLRLVFPTFDLPLIVHAFIGVFILFVVTGGGKSMSVLIGEILRAWRGTK